MGQNQKKHRKAIERRGRAKQKASFEVRKNAQMKLSAQYPEIVFTGQADPAFELLIRDAVRLVPLHSQAFPDWERRVYRTIKSEGRLAALKLLGVLDSEAAKQGQPPLDWMFHSSYGDHVFLKCGPALDKHLLRNDVFFHFGDGHIQAHFSQLEREVTPYGTYFVSPARPKVMVSGHEYTVGYSVHAIEQLADRVHPSWRTYAGHGDVFPLLHDTTHFLGCTVRWQDNPQHPAFAMFSKYSPGQSRRGIPIQSFVASLEEDDGSGLYIRIGYFPVGLNGEVATAKTYLRPGWSKTPESAAYSKRDIPRSTAKLLREIGTDNDPGMSMLHSHPQVLGFFHENGFPQVLRGSDPCFAHLNLTSPSSDAVDD